MKHWCSVAAEQLAALPRRLVASHGQAGRLASVPLGVPCAPRFGLLPCRRLSLCDKCWCTKLVAFVYCLLLLLLLLLLLRFPPFAIGTPLHPFPIHTHTHLQEPMAARPLFARWTKSGERRQQQQHAVQCEVAVETNTCGPGWLHCTHSAVGTGRRASACATPRRKCKR